MFFILSKTLYFLLMPLTWVLIALSGCFFCKQYTRVLFFTGLGMLFLFTNPFMSNELMRWWEVPPVPISTMPQYEVGIVLGGLTTDKEPRDRVHITGAADRVLQAAHLYREGKIRKILISGGSGKIIKDSIPEAVLLRQVLLHCKVPEQDILLEPASRNTHENAVNSALILNQKFPGKQYLLITSAYHMRRAKACFQQAGIIAEVYSVDMKSNSRQWTPDLLLFPKAEALGHWETVIREMVGMGAYWVAGYI